MLTSSAMTETVEWRCAAADLTAGHTAKFRLDCGGKRVNGFIVNHGGTYHAYVNRCPHVGTPLDLWENEFLSEDATVLVCATHGAVFEPATGQCIAGPCTGDALTTLPLRRESDTLIVGCLEGSGGHSGPSRLQT
jgi:nitrite reductase/ring-hydroxylating ferredoxin subunit